MEKEIMTYQQIDYKIVENILRPYNPKKSGKEYLIRCPICGDSKKDKNKRRFYMSQEGTWYCHNCGESGNLIQFYMTINNVTYAEAKLQIFGDNILDMVFDETPELTKPTDLLYKPLKLPPMDIKDFGNGMMSKRIVAWLKRRNLTSEYMKYNPKFMISMEDDTFGWLVIPTFYHGEIIEIQMRNVVQKDFRIYKNEDNDFVIYNYDDLDFSRPVIIHEGPFDALFIENSTCQFGVSKSKEHLIQYFIDRNIELIFMFDNDQAGYDGLAKLYDKYGNRFKAFVWDYSLRMYKDVNDAITNGIELNYKYIIDNSFVLSDAVGLNQINILGDL